MSLEKHDSIAKANLKRILAYMILVVGTLKITWFGFLLLFLLMDEKQTIPDVGMSISIVIVGIVEVLIAWIFLKWEEWQTPKI